MNDKDKSQTIHIPTKGTPGFASYKATPTRRNALPVDARC